MTDPTKYGTAHRECCPEQMSESGLRNNYFDGKRLSVDSFRVEQRYSLERRRLLNRAIHGWGVVYGYAIKADSPANKTGQGRLKVGEGLALDKCGRELLQTETRIGFDDVIILDEKGVLIDVKSALAGAGPDNRQNNDNFCWMLSVHYAERYTAPVTVNDPCRCEHHEWDQTYETVRYSLQRILCVKCCSDFECELSCKCGTGLCCDKSGGIDKAEGMPHKRGGCRCLCEHLTELVPGAECNSLCEIETSCTRVRVDLRNGVRLACVELVQDDCGRWTFGNVMDACGPRRLVKRNDLLFDLIRGCDLTRISRIGWEKWHRSEKPIPFEEFSEALGQKKHDQVEYVTNNFWVEFSRPVRKDTLRPDCFAMTVMSSEREGGWWQTFRVPIVRLDTTHFPPEAGDPHDHVRGATIVVDGAWVEDGVRGRRSLFLGSETSVEIEVRGDFIIDCNGQAVDANAGGLSSVPAGNGTPGGTFLSTFRVAPAQDASARAYPDDRGHQLRGVQS